VKERDSSGAPLRGGSLEVVYPPQHLDALMSKRSAKHSMSRQEDSLEIAGDERASG
jgi:hypothetical protein